MSLVSHMAYARDLSFPCHISHLAHALVPGSTFLVFVWCSVLCRNAALCHALHYPAVRCSVLQGGAVWCSSLV